MEATASAGRRRIVVWLFTIAAAAVVAGVFLQVFSIAAYVRGAGQGARDLHVAGGFVTHNIEVVVFLLAVAAFWGAWRRVGFALLLPVIDRRLGERPPRHVRARRRAARRCARRARTSFTARRVAPSPYGIGRRSSR